METFNPSDINNHLEHAARMSHQFGAVRWFDKAGKELGSGLIYSEKDFLAAIQDTAKYDECDRALIYSFDGRNAPRHLNRKVKASDAIFRVHEWRRGVEGLKPVDWIAPVDAVPPELKPFMTYALAALLEGKGKAEPIPTVLNRAISLARKKGVPVARITGQNCWSPEASKTAMVRAYLWLALDKLLHSELLVTREGEWRNLIAHYGALDRARPCIAL